MRWGDASWEDKGMGIGDKSDHHVNCKSDWIDGDFSLVIPNFKES